MLIDWRKESATFFSHFLVLINNTFCSKGDQIQVFSFVFAKFYFFSKKVVKKQKNWKKKTQESKKIRWKNMPGIHTLKELKKEHVNFKHVYFRAWTQRVMVSNTSPLKLFHLKTKFLCFTSFVKRNITKNNKYINKYVNFQQLNNNFIHCII